MENLIHHIRRPQALSWKPCQEDSLNLPDHSLVGITTRESFCAAPDLLNPSSNPTPSTNPNPKGRNHRRSKQKIEEFNLDELSPLIFTMADQRTMAQLLQAPTEGYEDACFPQQYPCCEDCGVLPEADHYQTPQYTVNHPIFNAHNDLLNSRTTLMEQMTTLTSMCEMIQKKQEEKQIEEEQAANTRYSKIPACCDDDDDYNSAITPNELLTLSIDPHHFDAESDLIESMLNRDSSIISSSSKIDSILDEFAGELTLLKSILPGIDKTDCYPKEDIRLIERLLYDNSSPRPPEEFVSENSDAEIESFSPSPIPIKDSDYFMKEINLSCTPDDPMPPSIEEDDYDSERDILILEELLDNYSLLRPVIESYHFDIPSFSRPPAKPPDGNTGILNIKMMGDNYEQKVPIPGLMISVVSNQEKSPDLLSHRGLENFQLSAKCPMVIHGKNIPILDVPLFHFYPLDEFKYGGISCPVFSKTRRLLPKDFVLQVFISSASIGNQRFDESCSEAWDRFKDLLRACPHHGFSELHQLDTFYNALNLKDQDSLNSVADVSTNTTSGISPDVVELKDMVKALLLDKKSQNQSPATVKAFEESCGENEPEATKDTVNPTNNGSIEDVQPQVVQSESLIHNSEPVTSLISEPVIALVSAPKPNPKSSIPYPSRINDERNHEKANNQIEKFYQIFKDMSFEISFADALILMPKFASTLKALHENKEKLSEMAQTLLNEHCSALSLPDLTPTCITLELADHSISHPVGVAEDVYVKLGSFHFSADFVVVDFDADPRVPLILGRSFLKTRRALIDVFEEVELKDLPPYLEYAFLEGDDKFPVIIAKDFSVKEKTALITVLKSHKRAIAWKLSDIKGINPEFCTHKILMEEDFEPVVQHQIRVNPKIHDVIKQEVIKLLDAGLIYPICYSPWVTPVHCVPKKGGFTVMENEDNELIQTHLVTDQEKTTFTCPYGTFAYRRMPFGLCNAPGTVQRHQPMSNWEKSHFMVKEGIVLGHKLSKQEIEVDKAKVDVITKLPHPTIVKGIRTFLGHAGFYRRFIKDFSKIARPMTGLLEKDTSFIFSKECVEAFQTLKRKLTEAPILIAPNWDIPFELMCDASDFAIGAVLGQCQDKHFRPIHYASKTITEAESNYTTTEKEMLAVVYAFKKFRSYLIMNKSIECTFKVIDTNEAENLAADHLSRLENPHQNVLDPKEINESFPLKTLNLVSTRGNQSTSWFVDFANYHAGNFVVKEFVLIKSSKGMYQARKPMKSSRLATMDPQRVTMAQITQPRRENKYILVDVDYLSKWVEAKALPTNDTRVVCKFLKNLFARFGTPRVIISDRGTHFCNDQFAKVMQKFSVTHRLATPYHHQTSGQVEVSNRGLKRILERAVGENRASWSDKLDDALWAFQTAYKIPIGCTPYKLVYGKACHLPIELEHKAYWALKHANFDLKIAGDHMKVQLNELNEPHDQAYENSLIYKEKTKRLHDSKIKDRVFNIDDRVLLFNSQLKIFSGKLKSRWSGPFTISHVYPYGTVELSQPDEPNFKVNGHRLKHYFGEDVPKYSAATRIFGGVTTPTEIRQFLGLPGYYRIFIKDFSKIAKSLTELTQKNKKYIWDEDQDITFHLLKQKLCEASILALPEGNGDFVVYCDASHQGLGAVLMQIEKKELNMRQCRWLELLADYDCENRYHPGKANVVADALSQKERIKPLRVRSLVMTIHPKLLSQILEAQTEAIKEENIKAENLRGIDKAFKIRPDGTRCIKNRSWLRLFGNLRDLIMHESHKSKYSIHPGSDKMYQDLKKLYWWPNMKNALGTQLDMSTAYHPETDRQSERTIQTLEDMLRACVIDFGKG
uniref:Integrase catalytic domain-containing protein n=1 Tax=Tanacetum cinerariifolium TaxID=118510 RepID=A0A6L2J907_TANCI|nr:hypothetical protein [Tanacetum cinerariifolium]